MFELFGLKLAFAGMWSMIAHWSIGVIIIAAVIVLEFGAGTIVAYVPLLAKPIAWVQKYLLFIGIGTALVLAGEWMGASNQAGRCDAKAAVVGKQVHKVSVKAGKDAGKRLDKWDTDQ